MVLFVFVLIVAHRSDASLFGKVRKLIGEGPKEEPNPVPPSPSPVLSVDPATNKSGEGTSGNVPTPANLPKEEPIDGLTDERCEISLNPCHDEGSMTACIKTSRGGHELLLLVQNDGESILKVKISPDNIIPEMQIPKHQAKKINISATAISSPSIVLNAGKGDCVIHMAVAPISAPFFATHRVTPIHGAYLLAFLAVIIGGILAWWKWGKKRRQIDGIPYQELEMERQDSISDLNMETGADGWDQGWDDDWDEDKAVKSPSGRNTKANGNWENNWDD